ncbi:MAG: DUF4185 domain-containing protein [Polyangiales bacterium]
MRPPAALVALVALAACADDLTPRYFRAAQWPQADRAFRGEARWLGGDGAYSVDLGGNRTLWLFGDSFVAARPDATRATSTMVRNSLAVMEGRDPATASVRFAFRYDDRGVPRSFFFEAGDIETRAWYWPAHGVRVPGGPLVIFLSRVLKTAGEGLGFAANGWRAVVIDNPDAEPDAWTPRILRPPAVPFDAVPGAAAVREGGYIYTLAPRTQGQHDAYLARLRESDVLRGELAPEWWTGAGWAVQEIIAGNARVVIEEAGTECSVHYDANLRRWAFVTSRGFGATTIAMRFADSLTGPWSELRDVYTPPESAGQNPFVYAAKAHPELTTGDASELVITYATNSFDPDVLLRPAGAALYWPRFVRVAMAR